MPLPKISTPSYELELPSTGETVNYRPFLVKEEKLLVIALESEDTKQITTAIRNVIRNCVLTKGIKVEDCLRLILNISSLTFVASPWVRRLRLISPAQMMMKLKSRLRSTWMTLRFRRMKSTPRESNWTIV